MKGEKKIQANGVEYTLTVRRNIVYVINDSCPLLLKKLYNASKLSKDEEIELGFELAKGIDKIFYEMIKIQHPNLTKQESDEILEYIYDEYEDFDVSLMSFIVKSFSQGTPEKKKLNW